MAAAECTPGVAPRLVLAELHFPTGTLLFTEAGLTKRASLHVVRGAAALRSSRPCRLEMLPVSLDEFADPLAGESHAQARAHRSTVSTDF